MSIYADKRGGKLTGKFRVELQRGTERYRMRHSTLQEAQDDEDRVRKMWEAGEVATPYTQPTSKPAGMTVAEAIDYAEGTLWYGKSNAPCNFAHLRYFRDAIGGSTPLAEVNTLMVRTMIKQLDREGKSDATINRYQSHLRKFLSWHHAEENIPALHDRINWDKRDERAHRMRWLTFQEEDQMVALMPEKTGKLVRVAMATGCRQGELLNAKANHIEGDHTFHIWDAKGNKNRSVPITPETAQMLRELTVEGMPAQRQLRRHWDAAKVEIGMADDKEFVFHACRHTCATRMVDADVDILLIKEWLGHEALQTTKRYAKVRPEKLRSILGRVGGLRALEAQEPQISASPHVPPSLPHTGVIGQIALSECGM